MSGGPVDASSNDGKPPARAPPDGEEARPETLRVQDPLDANAPEPEPLTGSPEPTRVPPAAPEDAFWPTTSSSSQTGLAAARSTAPGAWENENYFIAAGGTPAASVARKPAFADAPRRPLRFAGILMGVGILAIFFFDANFLHRLVLVAPVFEEALKFGVALAIVTLLRVTSPGLRAAIALLPGVGFGALEHYVTYAEEEPMLFAGRVAFHAASSMWSMTLWSALEPLPTWRHRWLATAPSTIVHAVNNGFAVLTAIALAAIEGGLAPGLVGAVPDIERYSLGVHAVLILVLGMGALMVLGAQEFARELVAQRVDRPWFRETST